MENTHENPLKHLSLFGQSIWLDDIRKDFIHNGMIQHMIDRDGLRGITSNPSIFENAIAKSDIYHDDIQKLASQAYSANKIYDELSMKDVREAADLFLPIYKDTKGKDGFVSLEVNPHISHDTESTIQEAQRLWKSLARPNIMIKVPATIEGLPAITQLISEGININVTLIFGFARYQAVMKAYIEGLKIRNSQGKNIEKVASVASFFLSRIDTLVDSLLPDQAQKIRQQTAIACGKVAYQQFAQQFENKDFKKLAEKGAQIQRLLWASTGTKNPQESDIKYVEPLIGKGTVNTLPMPTLDAYRDHGHPSASVEQKLYEAIELLDMLPEYGIDMEKITQQLENEGLDKFIQAYDKLIATIERKSKELKI